MNWNYIDVSPSYESSRRFCPRFIFVPTTTSSRVPGVTDGDDVKVSGTRETSGGGKDIREEGLKKE